MNVNLNVLLDLVTSMLYTFGDSPTYGWDLIRNGYTESERRSITWPSLLSRRLNQPLTDLSYPGVSNWRISRQIQNLELTPDDVVVIQWTNPLRFEFGVSDNYDYEKTLEEDDYSQFDVIDDDNGIRNKMMCYTLLHRTSEGPHREFMKLAYRQMRNDKWYEEMFRMMFSSCLYHLKKSDCKFIMFDGWTKQCDEKYFNDIPQYILRGTTMSNYVRGFEGWQLKDKSYPTPEEHQKCSDIIMQHLKLFS